MDYPFVPVQGAGVEEIPVGPVHAGIIEPGHFRFQAVGEDILRLEERLGYVHKGIEKIAVGRDPRALARLAGRVSGDTTVAHAWAACMAMEQAAGVTVPARANRLRAVLLECERVANHLGDIGAICNDVAFTFAYFQFSRMRERWLRGHGRVFGHRLLMDRVIPGGVSTDMDDAGAGALREGVAALRRDLLGILPILDDHPSLEDRLIGTGVLPRDAADRLGALGYVGRASGMDRDVRRDTPHAPYDEITVKVPVLSGGDVAARLKIRIEEIHAALVLVEQCLAALPGGDIQVPWPAHGAGEGVGIVEGWRGETLAYVRFDGAGRIARYFPRDPSWFSWPALEELIKGNIVPEFPVCNKSVNASYSGHDL
jgi:Ni,Fe-hydrogenase III large subunit